MNKQVAQNMSTNLVTISEVKSALFGLQLMQTYQIRHLLVVNSYGLLSGIVSITDLQRGLESGAQIKELMTEDLKVIEESASLSCAVEMMIELKITSLAVARGPLIIGIITTEDLLKVLDIMLRRNTLGQKLHHLAYNSTLGAIVLALAEAGI